MRFEDTGRIHITGEHKNEPIEKAIINNSNDIPDKVLEYFNSSHQFLCDLVGKENVIYSAIHFDEDTPHMHFYFTPIVNEVHRKVFETDNDGKQIMKSYIGKDGIQKLIPIKKKDETGKNIYTIEKGKFLNSDQFWKNKGFKTSYAKIQDDYNKYITDKGFNLDRGQIGANKHHTTKAEKYLEEIQEETKLVKEEYNQNKALNSLEIKYKDKISSVDINTLLSPEKGKFLGYKDKDITNLSNYSKELTKDNLNKEKELQQKDVIINNKEQYIKNLSSEIKKLKSGKTIQEKDIIIESQKNIIKEKDNIIYSLKQEISDLKTFIHDKLEDVKDVAVNLYKALKRTLGFDVNKHQEYDESSFKNISKNINKKYDKNKSDDFEL